MLMLRLDVEDYAPQALTNVVSVCADLRGHGPGDDEGAENRTGPEVLCHPVHLSQYVGGDRYPEVELIADDEVREQSGDVWIEGGVQVAEQA